MNKVLKKILIITSFIIILLAIIYFRYFMNDEIKTNDDIKYERYTISEHKGFLEAYDKTIYIEGYQGYYDYAYYINGKIKSSENENFILITFDLYDKDNNKIGIAKAGLNNIKKDKEYEFKAMSLEKEDIIKNVVDYKIKTIESK